jgi:hypothetical protein
MNDDSVTWAKEFWTAKCAELGLSLLGEKLPAPPAYFINLDQIYGDPREYGPYTSALEAYNDFNDISPAFDGASVCLIKVAPVIAGISPKQLRDNAMSEEDETGDPPPSKWWDLYDKSSDVVARIKWDVTLDRGGDPIYHRAENEYKPAFIALVNEEVAIETERQIDAAREEFERNRDPNPVDSIYESGWHLGFNNNELKEHLGQDKDGKFYYATESGTQEEDLFWSGPFETREEAEEGLSAAYDEWDKRDSEREQAYEDMRIAEFEKKWNTATQTATPEQRQASQFHWLGGTMFVNDVEKSI